MDIRAGHIAGLVKAQECNSLCDFSCSCQPVLIDQLNTNGGTDPTDTAGYQSDSF